MSFDPLSIFKEKIKSKPMPARGQGGKFVSAKPKETVKQEVQKETKVEPKAPARARVVAPLTFYGHEIRRFYYKGDWYFPISDVAKTAYLNAEDPRVRKGDPEKLAETKKGCTIQMDGIEVAKPKDIIKLVPYFKGNMPGPITSWLSENSNLPVPKVPEVPEIKNE